MIRPTYYNTNRESGKALAESKAKGAKQEDLVLWAYRREAHRRGLGMTAWEVYDGLLRRELIHARTPITSIRRAVTNLTDRGHLEKTDRKRGGPMGKPCLVYKLVKQT